MKTFMSVQFLKSIKNLQKRITVAKVLEILSKPLEERSQSDKMILFGYSIRFPLLNNLS